MCPHPSELLKQVAGGTIGLARGDPYPPTSVSGVLPLTILSHTNPVHAVPAL